ANCPTSHIPGACGVVNATDAVVGAPGIVAGDRTCLRGQFFSVFRNDSRTCGLGCSMIEHAGSAADCTDPFTAPILPDLDGDGHPSCGDGCNTDIDDIAAACGVTLPLPKCNSGKP